MSHFSIMMKRLQRLTPNVSSSLVGFGWTFDEEVKGFAAGKNAEMDSALTGDSGALFQRTTFDPMVGTHCWPENGGAKK